MFDKTRATVAEVRNGVGQLVVLAVTALAAALLALIVAVMKP